MTRPAECLPLGGTRLTWLSPEFARCECHTDLVWHWRRRGSRHILAGEWNKTAVALARLLTDQGGMR